MPLVSEIEGDAEPDASSAAALPPEMRALADRTTSPLLLLDPNGKIRYSNPAAAALVGWSPSSLTGTQVLNLVHPSDRARVDESLERVVDGVSSGEPVEYRIRGADGSWKTLAIVATNLLDHVGASGIVVSATDVTALRTHEAYLRVLAFQDPVTNLPNRRSLLDRLDSEMAKVQPLAVAFIDVDHFRRINDSLGHRFGDMVLRAAAGRLIPLVPADSLVAHFAADTFVVVLTGLGSDRAFSLVWELVWGLASPLYVEGRELNLTATAGVALRDPATTPDSILRDADAALTRAKSRRRGGVEVFNEEMRTMAVERLTMETDLRHAVERNELDLFVQPVVNLATREVEGGEALVRWMRRGDDHVSAEVFIALAEETGLIISIGDWVLSRAVGILRAGGVEKLSVNLSPRQLLEPGFPARVERLLRMLEVSPGRLLFEVTETFVVDNFDVASEFLSSLRQMGCPVGLDDFGSGYSSLGYLRRLPVDFLKLDRALVQDVDTDGQAARIAETIVALARSLTLTTIAEGIERLQQADALATMGCQYGQGFLFGSPRSISA